MYIHTFGIAVLQCTLVLVITATFSDGELKEMFKVGLRNIKKETINGEVMIEYGAIPTWLSGDFMRHSCGAFGEIDNMNDFLPNYIGHLFDCLGIGTKFRINNGTVTFTQRWYQTTVDEIFKKYNREMNKSSTFLPLLFSKSNRSQVDRWRTTLAGTSMVSQVPHISWWKVGTDAVAMTENLVGVIVDTDEVIQKGWIEYKDNNLGIPVTPNYGHLNNPAHEQTEQDGTLWSAVVINHFVSTVRLKQRRLVYKVDASKVRHVIGTYEYEDADLSKCGRHEPYADFNARYGYLHSFAMTKNYIILPETAYMHDPCYYTDRNKYEPFFHQAFRFEPNGFTRLLVMRKSDGMFIVNITMQPLFITHQLGSFEDGDLIHMDMLTYDDASIYTQAPYIKSLLHDKPYITNVSRVTINMTDLTASLRNLRSQESSPAALEMPNINPLYNGRKYKYGYLARNFVQKERNAILKLNVETGEETEYVFPLGMYVQEPHFIPNPDSDSEDSGVIIAHGVNGRKQKAFMVIVDARNMTLIGHVTAPDNALFGLHSRLFPLKIKKSGAQRNLMPTGLMLFILCCVFRLYKQL